MLCWFYARCYGTPTFQKVKLLSHQSTEYLLKSLGNNQDMFWQMWDEPLCSFWSAVAFALELSHGCRFCPVSYLLLNHDHWPKLRQVRACRSLNVVLGYFMTSWMSCRCALGVILVGRSLLGRFTTVTSFLHLWIMALTVMESQSIRNGFITLYRLTHVNYFVSHRFLNFFRSLHYVLLFKHASLCQTDSM